MRFVVFLPQAGEDEALEQGSAFPEMRLGFFAGGLRFVECGFFFRCDGFGFGDAAGFERLLDAALLPGEPGLLLCEFALRRAARFEDVSRFLIKALELAACGAQLIFDIERVFLHGCVGLHAIHDATHFLDALLQHALLAEVVALLLEEFGEAVAAFFLRAVLVGDALFDGRNQQAVDERFVRAAVLEECFDAAFGLVDGRDFVPFGRDDAEMPLDVFAIGLERIVLRKEMRRHAVVGKAAEKRRHFFLRGRAVMAVLLADERQLVNARAVIRAVFIGEFLRGALILAVQEQRDGRQRIAARVVLENPLDGDVSDGVAEGERLLDLALGDGLAWQHGLDERLDEDGLARAIFEQQNAVVAVELECRVGIALLAAVVNDVREADAADGWHGQASFSGDAGDGDGSAAASPFFVGWSSE